MHIPKVQRKTGVTLYETRWQLQQFPLKPFNTKHCFILTS